MELIDPELFPMVEEVRAANAATSGELRSFQAANGETNSAEALERSRALMEPGGLFAQPMVDDATDRVLPGPDGDICVRVFHPGAASAVYLHIHGGGLVMGSRRSQDQVNWRIAHQCGMVVVSTDYRLAPEHIYPAAHEDCEAVALWLLERAAEEFDTARLLIGGESAGAHLAACLLLRLRDRHRAIERIAGANLNCGRYDLTGSPSWVLPPPEHGLLASGSPTVNNPYYRGLDTEKLRDPDISPLYADLGGLCPALFTIGTADALLDDSVFMALRWELAGNRTELAIYPDGPHGLPGSPTEMGRRSQERIESFLKELAA